MLNNDLTRTDFHFKIIKFYLFVLLFEISSMIFIPKYVYIRWKKKKRKKPQEMNYSPLWPRSVVLLVEEDRCRLSRLKGTLFMNFTRFSRVYVSISYSAPLQMHRALTFIAEETSVRDRRSSIDRSKTSCETFFFTSI